ncbi:hypothetical protein HDF26_001169 [Pedobacter cryoconitis]|uniref:hypothetical protein n=1 Tax=Pedobacter cryoconitis TaxID=188932 RepID=UPI00160CC76E|nr:hypothetical protein [Pedobacter cryoconitis]MBB6270742.1 hypothetical protein [Pedobacter cryoconitis]
MKYFYNIIKADYLQRTRSYSFLITLIVTVYIAYLFVPLHTANYTTLDVPGFKGAYNSAWAGYISGIMTTVMLSIYGFLLVNNSIKKDIETEVGLIIASTPISNFSYLFSKQLSNFLVLLTIVGCTFIVSIIMFFVRGTDYPFVFSAFLYPYLIFAVPAMSLVASLAVVAEVFLDRKSILQFLVYFFVFGFTMAAIKTHEADSLITLIDPFGLKTMTSSITNDINSQFHTHIKDASFGFIFRDKQAFQVFVFEGVNWQLPFLLSRIVWIGFSLALVYFSSFFFHRFDFKQTVSKKNNKPVQLTADLVSDEKEMISPAGISRALLPPLVFDYSIFPFVKTELLLMIRKGNQLLWLVNAGLWIAMFFVSLPIAHSYLLPVLLFLQVIRWSDLTTKEKTNRLHYFSYAAYRPLFRILPAQILSGIIVAMVMALPVIVRYAIISDLFAVVNIINGSVLIILLAVCLGIITEGKKLYEIIFFMLTYSAVNKLPITDYLGGAPHDNHLVYISVLSGLNIILVLVSFIVRNYQSRHI